MPVPARRAHDSARPGRLNGKGPFRPIGVCIHGSLDPVCVIFAFIYHCGFPSPGDDDAAISEDSDQRRRRGVPAFAARDPAGPLCARPAPRAGRGRQRNRHQPHARSGRLAPAGV
ncbi:hypothetical protein G6F31_019937 [Rhizopus arrhizus]|nr:hypothetical protein G6F31_019937 [Rhizopus arrhizus]